MFTQFNATLFRKEEYITCKIIYSHTSNASFESYVLIDGLNFGKVFGKVLFCQVLYTYSRVYN